jgi:predicted phage terminase large subunit-like protein
MAVSREAIEFVSKHDYFSRFATKVLDGNDHIPTPFDPVINDVLDKTFTGEISRLIINIPPGFGKTAKAVWAYVARGFAINPVSRFIHASYSDKLVQDNSSKIRDLINHRDYQMMYPYVNFKEDSQAKGLWKTDRGGAFLASPSGGSITGFRAGLVNSDYTFTGALIIDDPLKPDDSLSDTKRDFINQRWDNTFRSRLAHPDVPVIVIMQRIHAEDFTWHLLQNTDEDWHHLVLPAYIDPAYEYQQLGRYIEHGLPEGSLWSLKADDAKARELMGNIQYSQEPTPHKGEVYEREWFKRYTQIPGHIKKWAIYCDTASKTKKYNDFSVFQLWAQTVDNKGYLIKMHREKIKVPFLLGRLQTFYRESLAITGASRIPISIEDKDSGVGLIQGLELLADDEGNRYKVTAIQRKEGKYARALKAAPHVKDGEIYIPVGPQGDGLITEATSFKADDSHKHDDQIDPMNDFINHELPSKGVGRASLPAGAW